MSRHSRRDAPFVVTGSKPPRNTRVAQQLRQELSQLMMQEMKDPRIRLASVSEVLLSGDLRQARVFVSVIGEDHDREQVIHALRHAEGFLRGAISHRLENLHSCPRLHFELDESIAQSIHMSKVMRDLEQQGEMPAEDSSQEAAPADE